MVIKIMDVLRELYSVILDRKANPVEGSYTNYLLDKGTDKISKKVGEEATETVIAAKNGDNDELMNEINDLLYHVMVLAANQGLSWEEVERVLAERNNVTGNLKTFHQVGVDNHHIIIDDIEFSNGLFVIVLKNK